MDSSGLPNKVLTSAPGKIILHGEHAVVHGTTALATSLNLRFYVELTANSSKVSLNFPDMNLEDTWNVSDLEETFCNLFHFRDDHMPYLDEEGLNQLKDFAGLSRDNTKNLAVIAFLYLYLCIFKSSASRGLHGMNALAASNLPTGAGLGSSAAFSASLVSGLLIFSGKLQMPPVGCDWTGKELELINKWAFEGEKVIHGNPSGVDNAVSVFGGALRYKSKIFERLHEMPSLRVLLINTKVPRSTKVLVAGVKDKLEKYPGVIKPVFDSIEDISQRCETLLSSLWHLEKEDDSVEGATHNRVKLYDTMEELIDMNQSFLKILGVSHPSIENICTLTSEFDIHAKLTGAGGGGCVFAVLRPDYPQEKIEMVTTKLKNVGYEAWVTYIGGVGVTYHDNVDDVLKKGFILPKPLVT